MSSASSRFLSGSDLEKTQLYMQRYIAHFPAAGEIVIFDRSWYNRAGLEYVMGFCNKEQHRRFLDLCPVVERYFINSGIILIKFWLEVSNEEQGRRFEARIEDPLRQWKLSPIDMPSRQRWYDYSRARDMMFEATDTSHTPWYIVRSDDKKRARLNCISHLLSLIPREQVPRKKVKLPKRALARMHTTIRSRSKAEDLCRKNTEYFAWHAMRWTRCLAFTKRTYAISPGRT